MVCYQEDIERIWRTYNEHLEEDMKDSIKQARFGTKKG